MKRGRVQPQAKEFNPSAAGPLEASSNTSNPGEETQSTPPGTVEDFMKVIKQHNRQASRDGPYSLTRGNSGPSSDTSGVCRAIREIPQQDAVEIITEENSMIVQNPHAGEAMVCVTSRGTEVRLRDLTPAEKELFSEADKEEWQAVLMSGGVKVISEEESSWIQRNFPDRIVDSRLVRRWEPLPGLGQFRAKSRCCISGRRGPDTSEAKTYAPSPQDGSILLFLQTALNAGLDLDFAKARDAFTRSNSVRRPDGVLVFCSYETKTQIFNQ